MATFTKLKSGEWGLRVDGTAKSGQTVSVKKKSGEVETKTIGKVIWTGKGISLCTIADSKSNFHGHATRRDCLNAGFKPEYEGSGYCGYPCPVTGMKCCSKNGPCHDCQ